MAKTYQWKTSTRFESTTTLSHGIDPTTYENWQTAEPGDSQSIQCSYYYRDCNTIPESDSTSSRVIISLTERWHADIDRKNNLIITLNTTINSINRDDIRGEIPTHIGRLIQISREQGGRIIWQTTDNLINEAKTLSGQIALDQIVLTIPPGEQLERSSLFLHNELTGSPRVSYDNIWLGVCFKNILPRDYRPGAVLKGAEQWMPTTGDYISHNRLNGACHVRTNNSWQECRTTGGFDGEKGNPPLILTADNDSSWRDQKLIGKEN